MAKIENIDVVTGEEAAALSLSSHNGCLIMKDCVNSRSYYQIIAGVPMQTEDLVSRGGSENDWTSYLRIYHPSLAGSISIQIHQCP